MKRLRYYPASSPGLSKPPSKNALLRSQQRSKALLKDATQENTRLTNELNRAKSDATYAHDRLRQLYSTRVSTPLDLHTHRKNFIECAIRIDADFPYSDPASVLFAAVTELLTNIMKAAPRLMLGSQKDFFDRLRQVPTKHRDEKIYLIWRALAERLNKSANPYSKLAQLFQHGLHPYTFSTLLTLAAEHSHLLDENPHQIPAGPRLG